MSTKQRTGGAVFGVLLLVVVVGGVGFFFLNNTHGNHSTPTTTVAPKQTENMLFDDEFNGTSIDPSKWNIEARDSEPQYDRNAANPFLGYYVPQNVTLVNGLLDLKVQNQSYNGKPYTTGGISTAGKFMFTYGRVEIRAKLIKGKGIKAALWLLGAKCQDFGSCADWPAPGYDEIDMMEQVGQRPTNIYMTNHFTNAAGAKASKQCINHSDTQYSDSFHVFSIDWRPGKITWSIDGKSVCESTVGVPSTPMFLIINTTVGGPFGQKPTAATPFPQDLMVDYVRVYK